MKKDYITSESHLIEDVVTKFLPNKGVYTTEELKKLNPQIHETTKISIFDRNNWYSKTTANEACPEDTPYYCHLPCGCDNDTRNCHA